MFDEEFIQKPNTKPIDLELLSVSELEERIIALREEILRCESEITKKKSTLNAAQALFGNHNG
jgi:uncharacterized small protein (DUF1192 family)